jgi:4-hydroxy-tetrahydrodipicolinate reductase
VTIRVCLAGATGWAGSALARRIAQTEDIELVAAVSRAHAGRVLGGSQVHSIRLPGYVISVEILFGMSDQRLTISHDSGTSAESYVDGALPAIRKVDSFIGLRRGLDTVLDLG